MLAKALMPETDVAVPAKESKAVKDPKPIAEPWAMVKAFLFFLQLGGSEPPRPPISSGHQRFFEGESYHRLALVKLDRAFHSR